MPLNSQPLKLFDFTTQKWKDLSVRILTIIPPGILMIIPPPLGCLFSSF
jgi:hypothetical protein